MSQKKKKPQQQTVSEYFSSPQNRFSEIEKHLKYYNRVKRILDAHQTKQALTSWRDNLKQSQDRLNKQLEIERLIGEQSRGPNPMTRERLQKRVKKLEEFNIV